MSHQTLFVRVRSRKPLFEIAIGTFTGACVGKVEVNDDITSVIPFCIFLANLAEENEFLRSRVGDGRQNAGADFDVELVLSPMQTFSTE